MSKSELSRLFGAAGKMLLLCVLVFSQSVWAQDRKTKDNPKSPKQSAVEQIGAKVPDAASEKSVAEEKSGDPSHQAIKVHGHWTIEVHNPDGSLVTHREFENSLHPAGPQTLSLILSRQYSVGTWQINLLGAPDVCVINGQATQCAIAEGNVPSIPGVVFANLTVTAPAPGQTTVQLQGTATAQLSGTIIGVTTGVWLCSASNPVTTPCFNRSPGSVSFTGLTLATLGTNGNPVVNVAAGQTIAVTVVISFS